MGIHYKQANIHWNYFLAIEKDFETLSRYIEFTESNNQVFSIELARLLMSATQETDVVLKQICQLVNPKGKAETINDYKEVIINHIPEFIGESIHIHRFGMSSMPWENWGGKSNPDWWQANNKIKHQRVTHFELANLKNKFNSIGGLLISILYYYNQILRNDRGERLSWKETTNVLKPSTALFRLQNDYYQEPGEWTSIEW